MVIGPSSSGEGIGLARYQSSAAPSAAVVPTVLA